MATEALNSASSEDSTEAVMVTNLPPPVPLDTVGTSAPKMPQPVAANTMVLRLSPLPPWRARYLVPISAVEREAAARLRASIVADSTRQRAK